MSSNQFLIDASSRHAVFLQRYSAGVEKDAARLLGEGFKEIYRILGQEDISGLSGASFGSMHLQLIDEFSQNMTLFSSSVMDELERFVIQEAEFSTEMLNLGTKASVIAPEPQQLLLALNLTDMNLDHPISINSALSKYGEAKVKQVSQIVRDAYIEGLTSQQAISKVKDIVPLQTRQAASLVRTANNAASTVARTQTMIENMDIFEGYEWVSTLDSRTSHVCMARDGKIYPFRADSPKPPAHWSCRSTIIPKVKRAFDLLRDVEGDRPSVGANGVEQVGANTTYGGWLRKQPASFQDEVLGDTRAKLFRRGGLKIESFSDPSGRTYTLDELRSLNPLAFERAGL